jgi:hypothetical protein
MATEQEVMESLLPIARGLVKGPRVHRSMPAGYGIKPGERVLIAVNSMYDEVVVKAVAQAIREAGAAVDIISYDMGFDRELEYIDEFNGFIHCWRDIKEENPLRTWIERTRPAERIAEDHGYDLLIHTLGGPLPPRKGDRSAHSRHTAEVGATSHDYEGIPWVSREMFPAAKFPFDVWNLINRKAMERIWNNAPGGRARLTDPEGTDISWTYWDEYFDMDRYKKTGGAPLFQKEPFFGHLFAKPSPPFSPRDDTGGVISGTTNHIGRPFPNIKVYLKHTKVQRVEGGGPYGDLFRDLLNETKDYELPEYPDKGLLYWWELAIGTNPKMVRPFNAFTVSGAGTVSERLRSGVIHCGIGTPIYGPSEIYAKQKKLAHGHIHVHLLFATFEITNRKGEVVRIIDNGRLTALDDPEVIQLASNYGDPKELLKEDWIAPLPGISVPGDYDKDYAVDPFSYIKSYYASTGKTSAR